MRPIADLVIYEEDLSRINACLSALQRKARSAAILLIDTSGQLIASAGATDGLDTTPLASLAAGSIAAAGALAQLLGEKEFSFVFYDGERKRLHLSLIGSRAILLVLLDQNSAVALVRLQVKKFSREMEDIFTELSRRPNSGAEGKSSPSKPAIGEITDDDVENLFGKG
ncbi:MAG: roadblock/LC7 domain-containing protein [candidate division NC10 bacterium]|nr:roadblock/LC7 domain-containing protein [candidate division NC10 bacterium]